jgi:hypothetical protein
VPLFLFFFALSTGLGSAAHAGEKLAIVGTETEATAIVQSVLDAALSSDQAAFDSYTDTRSILIDLRENRSAPSQRLTISSVADAFRDCELISLRDSGSGMTEIQSRCGGQANTPASYMYIISGKIRIFYPFQMFLTVAAPSQGGN